MRAAVRSGDLAEVERLLAGGARADAAALAEAVSHGSARLVQTLLDHGANAADAYAAKRPGSREALDVLLANGARAAPALIGAAYLGDAELCRSQLARLEAPLICGEARTVWAHAGASGNLELLEVLLGEGGVPMDKESLSGVTDIAVARWLLARGAAAAGLDSGVLTGPVFRNDAALVELLMQAGADPNQGNFGSPLSDRAISPMLFACDLTPAGGVPPLDAIRAMIHGGGRVDQSSGAGITPLGMALRRGQLPIVELMIAECDPAQLRLGLREAAQALYGNVPGLEECFDALLSAGVVDPVDPPVLSELVLRLPLQKIPADSWIVDRLVGLSDLAPALERALRGNHQKYMARFIGAGAATAGLLTKAVQLGVQVETAQELLRLAPQLLEEEAGAALAEALAPHPHAAAKLALAEFLCQAGAPLLNVDVDRLDEAAAAVVRPHKERLLWRLVQERESRLPEHLSRVVQESLS